MSYTQLTSASLDSSDLAPDIPEPPIRCPPGPWEALQYGSFGRLCALPSVLFYPPIVSRLGSSSFVWEQCLLSGLGANFLLNFWVKLYSLPAAACRDELPETSFVCVETR